MRAVGYRTSTDVYFLDAPPERVWELVADPTVIEELVAHGVTFEPERHGPASVGETWVEVHGPECNGDRVPWTVVEARAPELIRLHGWQSGMRQEATYELSPHDGGTMLRTRLTLTPTLRGRSKERPLTWLLFATGVLGWLVARDPDLVKQNLPARLRSMDEPLSS